ncbi:hypothetical protein [Frateuria defendens]|nr:hypothetical protein [Frateuria defendens]
MTDAEGLLWYHLRNRRLLGWGVSATARD